MSPTTTFTKQLLMDMDLDVKEMKLQMSEIRNSNPTATTLIGLPFMTDAIQPMLDKAMQNAFCSTRTQKMFQQILPEISLQLKPIENKDPIVSSVFSVLEEKRMLNSQISSSSSPRRFSEQEVRWQYSNILGILDYRAQIIRIESDDYRYGESNRRECETTWTFVPARWLLSKAISLIFARSTQGWKQCINYFSVVPSDSPLFAYCLSGNADGVRDLLRRKVASPKDRDDQGFTALHVCFLGNICQ
jgi:hypothetical protein